MNQLRFRRLLSLAPGGDGSPSDAADSSWESAWIDIGGEG